MAAAFEAERRGRTAHETQPEPVAPVVVGDVSSGAVPVVFERHIDQIVVEAVELVLAALQREAQAGDALMLLHRADHQRGQALVAVALLASAVAPDP